MVTKTDKINAHKMRSFIDHSSAKQYSSSRQLNGCQATHTLRLAAHSYKNELLYGHRCAFIE